MEIILLIESIAVTLAAIAAVYGITAWRRELKWRKKYELAEEVLTLFYEAKDRIHAIRSPGGYVGEGSSRKKDPKESEEEAKSLDLAYTVFERYQKYQEIFNRIHAMRYRFMTLFGPESREVFDNFNALVNKILGSARILSKLWIDGIRDRMIGERDQRNVDRIQKYEKIFWEEFEDDPIQTEMEKVIERIEQICKPILNPKPIGFRKTFLQILGLLPKR